MGRNGMKEKSVKKRVNSNSSQLYFDQQNVVLDIFYYILLDSNIYLVKEKNFLDLRDF